MKGAWSHARWHRNGRNGEEKEQGKFAGGKRICVAGSMRVVPSGVWRRAFVRSCVSLFVTEAAPIWGPRRPYCASVDTQYNVIRHAKSTCRARYSFACRCCCLLSTAAQRFNEALAISNCLCYYYRPVFLASIIIVQSSTESRSYKLICDVRSILNPATALLIIPRSVSWKTRGLISLHGNCPRIDVSLLRYANIVRRS